MRIRSLSTFALFTGLLTACSADPMRPDVGARSFAKADAPVRVRFTEPVDVTMEGGPGTACGLAVDVHLAGELTVNIHVTTTGNGRRLAHVISSARGTAEGDDGSRYVWSYNQAVRVTDFTDAIPTPGSVPQTSYVTDRFHLSGLGGAPDVSAHILFGVQLDAQGNPTILRDRSRDAVCDPI